jgi:hypothetical protein
LIIQPLPIAMPTCVTFASVTRDQIRARPKNSRSPGWVSSMCRRCERGISAAIAAAVRPWMRAPAG